MSLQNPNSPEPHVSHLRGSFKYSLCIISCQIKKDRSNSAGVQALLLGWSELKCHLEKIQGCKPLSNAKTTEEIRDGSPSFTIWGPPDPVRFRFRFRFS